MHNQYKFYNNEGIMFYVVYAEGIKNAVIEYLDKFVANPMGDEDFNQKLDYVLENPEMGKVKRYGKKKLRKIKFF